MKSAILIAAALLAAPAVEAGTRLPTPSAAELAPDNPNLCTISMVFGSFGPGIDRPTLTRVERLLRSDRRVRNFSSHPWGREGEVTLCVHLRRASDAAPLGRQLRRMIPARPRGPIELHAPGLPRSR